MDGVDYAATSVASRSVSRIAVLVVALGLLAAACGGTSSAAPSTAPSTPSTVPLKVVPADIDEFRAQPVACGGDLPPRPDTDRAFDAPRDMGLDPSGTTRLVLRTSCGDVTVELDVAEAPATTNALAFLADEGFFDGTVLHRVIPGFVVQGGDPTASGYGGPGFTVPDEFPTDSGVYRRGVVAMANAGPGTTGSQFFILLDDAPLPPTFTVVGRVVEGMDVVDTIAGLPLGRSRISQDPVASTPLETPFVEAASVEQSP